MSPTVNTIVSCGFLVSGAVAIVSIMIRLGRQPANAALYVAVHRASGWIFTILFLFMFITMLSKVQNFWEEAAARVALHVALAVGVLFLLALKVSIPRFFPMLKKNLWPLGTAVYLLSFVLVGITAGYYILWRSHEPYSTAPKLPAAPASLSSVILSKDLGRQLLIAECTLCHRLPEVLTPRSEENWRKVIERMVELASPRITADEAVQIRNFLATEYGPKLLPTSAESTLLERHCLPCHRREDIFSVQRGRVAWVAVVTRMHENEPELVPKNLISQIVDHILDIQRRNNEESR